MSTYPQQLVAELSEHLSPIIINFYNDTRENYNYPVSSINELVEYVLENSFDGKTSREDLQRLNESAMRNRRKKKKRWMEKLKSDMEIYTPNDTEFPFSNLVSQKHILSKSQWEALYGKKTLDDIINEKMAETDEWYSQTDSFFICFPAIYTQTPHKIYTSIVSDTMLYIYQYIKERYDGSIENYFLSFPKDLIGFPLFAPKKVRLKTSSGGDSISESYDYGEGILETTANLYSVNEQLNSMDQNDLKIFYATLQNLDSDFYTTRQVHVKKSILAKLFHSRPGRKYYDMMEKHCHMLSKYNFSVTVNGRKKISFNLLDSVDSTDPDEVVFTYGSMLYDSIIANDITNIKSSNMQLLEQNLSTILYHPLFRERIILSSKLSEETDELISDYSYSFFSRNVRFPNQSRKKNLELIESSLKEFAEKKILIKSFEVKSATLFRIHFFPLTPEEQADLNFNRFKSIQALPASDDDLSE